jgi:hypothetical protein
MMEVVVVGVSIIVNANHARLVRATYIRAFYALILPGPPEHCLRNFSADASDKQPWVAGYRRGRMVGWWNGGVEEQ